MLDNAALSRRKSSNTVTTRKNTSLSDIRYCSACLLLQLPLHAVFWNQPRFWRRRNAGGFAALLRGAPQQAGDARHARVCASSAQRCEYEPFVGRRRATLGEESRKKFKVFLLFLPQRKSSIPTCNSARGGLAAVSVESEPKMLWFPTPSSLGL